MLSLAWHWITNWIIGWGGIGALVSIAAWALWYFTPVILLSFKSLLLHIAVGATIFTVTSTYFFTNGYNIGYTVAINQVAANTKEAQDAINKAAQSVDDCTNRNGVWDTVSGLCDR